jgi:anaerobic magnesium-protoporphyrin IX monomethyl ester cyclase
LKPDSEIKPYHVLFISLYNTGATGVRHLSSILKQKGYRTSIILFKSFHGQYTQSATPDEYDLLMAKISELQPDIIGLSCLSLLSDSALPEISRLIRINHPDIPLIAGGPCFTTAPAPEKFLIYFDYIFLGYCEDIILDIIICFQSKGEIRNLPNLYYRDESGYKRNSLKPLNSNLDASFSCFPDIGGRDKYIISNGKISDIDTEIDPVEYSIICSRGCPFNCAYCCNASLKRIYKSGGKLFAIRSVSNVIKELKHAKARLNKNTMVRFWDDIFPYDNEWIQEFCIEYKQHIHLPFTIYCHPLLVRKSNLDELVKAGLQMVVMGIQHGSKRIRNKIYHRTESDNDIIEATKIIHDSGVPTVYYDLILDSPFETIEDLQDTYDLCMKLHKPFTLQFHSLDILPGTAIEQMVVAKGLLKPQDLEALRARSLEEQLGSFLWHQVKDGPSAQDEIAYWKNKIYESQFADGIPKHADIIDNNNAPSKIIDSDMPARIGTGWHQAQEDSGTHYQWTGQEAEILIEPAESTQAKIIISLNSFYKARRCDLSLNGKRIASKNISKDQKEALELVADFIQGPNILKISSPDKSQAPAEIPQLLNPDKRSLSFVLWFISIKKTAGSASHYEFTSTEYNRL